MDGVSDIEVEENHFTQLKNAICRINFSIKLRRDYEDY